MSNGSERDFRLTWPQKLSYMVVPLLMGIFIILMGPVLQGGVGTVLFLLMGVALGIVTWYITSGWNYRLSLTRSTVEVRDVRTQITVPLDRIGMVVRNGRFPFPTLWLVLRNAEVGMAIPARGVDPEARSLIEAYQKRNPGKKLTIVKIPGGHIRSIRELIADLKQRIPPLAVDERLMAK